MLGIKSLIDVDFSHGGKASGLKRLLQLGFNVPKGVAIDSDSVQKLLNGDPSLQTQLEDWLNQVGKRVAVRSSATNEDNAVQSFAGAYETILAIDPKLDLVVAAIRQVTTSGQSDRVRHYSGQTSERIPVVVQELVEAQSSGVLFSKAIGPDGSDCTYVEWTHGFGDALVSGRVTPGTIVIPWNSECTHLIRDRLQINRDIPEAQLVRSLIDLTEILNRDAGPAGWDIEWAVDIQNKLWALQMRPVTAEVLTPGFAHASGPLPASAGIGMGLAKFVDDTNHGDLEEGEVLVARITEVNYIPAMKRAAAIVTEEGGLLSHAAIVAREFRKPCVVGATNARSILKDGGFTEVDGTKGTVRQRELVMGAHSNAEIDWTSVYLYDRGVEIEIDGMHLYVEPTMAGLVGYLDADSGADEQTRANVSLRRLFQTTPHVVTSDKRIWHREWRRFDRLRSVAFIDSRFRAAIATWNQVEFHSAIALLKRAVDEIKKLSPRTSLDALFWKELGAALHALVAVEVEGRTLWAAYRDSAAWRICHGVKFIDLLRATSSSSLPDLDRDIRGIPDCLAICADFRNEAYNYFSSNNVFDGSYFGNREAFVRSAVAECNILFVDEDTTLTQLYSHSRFRDLDQAFSRQLCLADNALDSEIAIKNEEAS